MRAFALAASAPAVSVTTAAAPCKKAKALTDRGRNTAGSHELCCVQAGMRNKRYKEASTSAVDAR